MRSIGLLLSFHEKQSTHPRLFLYLTFWRSQPIDGDGAIFETSLPLMGVQVRPLFPPLNLLQPPEPWLD